jgi:paraquat-inducible protein A
LSPIQHALFRSLAFTLAAIALYIPANIYPFMTMNYAGQYQNATVWDGISSLFESGMIITAGIVFFATIIIPAFKFISLLFIISTKLLNFSSLAHTNLLAFVEFIGRWSMLDIFIVAIMVALIKFASFATVSADIASYLLGGVVILTMLASSALAACVKEK